MGKTEKMERMARAKEACETFWADVKADREGDERISLIAALECLRDENDRENRKYFEDELDVKFIEYFSIMDSEKKRIRYEVVAEMYCDKTPIMRVMLTDLSELVPSTGEASVRRSGVIDEVLLLVTILSCLNGENPSEDRVVAELQNPPVKK